MEERKGRGGSKKLTRRVRRQGGCSPHQLAARAAQHCRHPPSTSSPETPKLYLQEAPSPSTLSPKLSRAMGSQGQSLECS